MRTQMKNITHWQKAIVLVLISVIIVTSTSQAINARIIDDGRLSIIYYNYTIKGKIAD